MNWRLGEWALSNRREKIRGSVVIIAVRALCSITLCVSSLTPAPNRLRVKGSARLTTVDVLKAFFCASSVSRMQDE